MVKVKTSQKRKKSLENIQKFKLKSDTGVTPYSPTEEILEGDLIGKALLECLRNNDPDGAMEVIAIYLNTIRAIKRIEKAHLSRSTLYHSLKYRNPTIKTLAKMLSVENINSAKK